MIVGVYDEKGQYIDPYEEEEYEKVLDDFVSVKMNKQTSLIRNHYSIPAYPDEEDKFNSLSEDEYLSILYSNLGFKNHPDKNDNWWMNGINSNLTKSNKLLSSVRKDYSDIIVHKTETLDEIIKKINFWFYGEVKNGNLLDLENSFDIDEKKLRYNQQHNIASNLSFLLFEDEYYWDSAEILNSRLYDLNPDINKEYFEFCIRDEELLLSVEVQNPHICFLLCAINPDILFSIIRRCEINACMDTFREQNLDSYALINDEDSIVKFESYLNDMLNTWWEAYQKFDISGLEYINEWNLRNQEEKDNQALYDKLYKYDYISPKRVMDIMDNFDKMIDDFSLLSEYQKDQLFANMVMTESKYMFVNKRVDMRYIPKKLEEDENMRELVYRRLYICLTQMEKYYPDLLDDECGKLAIVEEGYISPIQFCLYNKKYNCFIILQKRALPTTGEVSNFVTEIHSPKSTVRFYLENYNIHFKLSSKAMAVPQNQSIPEYTIPDNMNVK